MAADDANYIEELDLTKPAGPDSAGDGDDEIRTTKRAVQNTLAGNDGSVDWDEEDNWFDELAYPTDPDLYDTTVKVGPRFLNQLPKTQNAIANGIIGLQLELDALAAAVAAIPGGIPVGTICMWSGGAPPALWALCDGTAGTPDLRDRFIVGAGSTFAQNASGAGTTVTGAGSAHTHTATIGATALTIAQMPLHGHPWKHWHVSSNGPNSRLDGGLMTSSNPGTYDDLGPHTGAPGTVHGQQIGGAGGGGTHTHTGSNATESAHTHPVTVLPRYYALAFIQYKGV